MNALFLETAAGSVITKWARQLENRLMGPKPSARSGSTIQTQSSRRCPCKETILISFSQTVGSWKLFFLSWFWLELLQAMLVAASCSFLLQKKHLQAKALVFFDCSRTAVVLSKLSNGSSIEYQDGKSHFPRPCELITSFLPSRCWKQKSQIIWYQISWSGLKFLFHKSSLKGQHLKGMAA